MAAVSTPSESARVSRGGGVLPSVWKTEEHGPGPGALSPQPWPHCPPPGSRLQKAQNPTNSGGGGGVAWGEGGR